MARRLIAGLTIAVALMLSGCGSGLTAGSGITADTSATGDRATTTGSVKVTLSPSAAVSGGARWTLDSATTQNTSGTTLSGLAAGSHTVKFTAVQGYTKPADQTITVTAGKTTAVTGTYVAGVGSVKVTLAPSAVVSAGARWVVDAGTATYASGATVSKLAVGTHTLTFQAVTGYVTPAAQTVTVTANQTTAVTVTYVQLGALKVTLSPTAAIGGGGKWMLDGATITYASGATVSGLAAGTHTLRFTSAIGYATPADQAVTVSGGTTTSVTVTYQQAGSLKVTLMPSPAVNAGARWTLDSGTTAYPSATTISGIAVGTHTVKLKAVTGYSTPADVSVTIKAGATTAVAVTYRTGS